MSVFYNHRTKQLAIRDQIKLRVKTSSHPKIILINIHIVHVENPTQNSITVNWQRGNGNKVHSTVDKSRCHP